MKSKTFHIKNYKKPTPQKWRNVGDSLIAMVMFIGGGGILSFDKLSLVFDKEELKLIIGLSIIIGCIGKFLSNFFKIEEKKVAN